MFLLLFYIIPLILNVLIVRYLLKNKDDKQDILTSAFLPVINIGSVFVGLFSAFADSAYNPKNSKFIKWYYKE